MDLGDGCLTAQTCASSFNEIYDNVREYFFVLCLLLLIVFFYD